jgi:hypothetical protein
MPACAAALEPAGLGPHLGLRDHDLVEDEGPPESGHLSSLRLDSAEFSGVHVHFMPPDR